MNERKTERMNIVWGKLSREVTLWPTEYTDWLTLYSASQWSVISTERSPRCAQVYRPRRGAAAAVRPIGGWSTDIPPREAAALDRPVTRPVRVTSAEGPNCRQWATSTESIYGEWVTLCILTFTATTWLWVTPEISRWTERLGIWRGKGSIRLCYRV